ncbi:MAG TPA: alpha-1,4-glucan--maltose-1-phosphate maltosyltransferase, partial [Planctomycetaceae bacterium]|nr:alpha-1,4-glucan--maltose-1-phosphate maltosyltransferase [Planctomycetaceae bacterium]
MSSSPFGSSVRELRLGVFGRTPAMATVQRTTRDECALRPPSRVIIEQVRPEIDAGRFPIKRTPGETVRVSADIFTDGHDLLSARLLFRKVGDAEWTETPLQLEVNDTWTASFPIVDLADYEYTAQAWVDRFGSWARDLSKKAQAGQAVVSELLEGAAMIRETADRATGPDVNRLQTFASAVGQTSDTGLAVRVALGTDLSALMELHADRTAGAEYPRVLRVMVERERARHGAWYEIFPRSTADQPGRHGTLRDLIDRLPYIAGMGFDVLYLPPIHPIGLSFRKGPNNSLEARPEDPGSPWAIGSPEGGHTAIHPALGTFDDFEQLRIAAESAGLELALDIAFQCSPDHPWVREHPEWFRHRPDGTIKYAENPPKKYQDIYPLDFECADWKSLWNELCDVVLFWCERGVRIFRVDNPHTKPLPFWEWLIREVRSRYRDAVFLSEAFTRPKIMKHLAKGGFSQSYSYFTWRNTKPALTAYFQELMQTDVCEYLRPNLFVNTPDILHEFLQTGGRPAFQLRLVLAATLGANYGVYGPMFERCVGDALHPGSEEYRDSEKYQVRFWDFERTGTLYDFVARINRLRRENPALAHDRTLKFYDIDNPQMIAFGKSLPDLSNSVLV